MLSLKNISKRFGSRQVLDKVSLDVARGEIAVLLGSSGVGKSTLLRVLSSLETADDGVMTLDDLPLDHKRIRDEHLVGMVFQQFNLFPNMTATRNITLALQGVLKESAAEARHVAHKLLDEYGLGSKKDAYPGSLSGGQKQRLAIARTVAMKPKIICMDEPTSALDPLLTAHVAGTITRLAEEGYIVLLASHDTELLKRLNCTIYLMDAGKIVEKATSQEFLTAPERFSKIDAFVQGVADPDAL